MEGIALKTENDADQIALRGVRVRSRLAALGQKTTVEQTFVNLEDHAIEALYTFPLPEDAAVCEFEVITGDRVLTGQVEEAGKAEDVYDEVISRGHGAFLLEQNRPDIFTVNVGNLKAKQAVTVRLTYLAELEVTDSSIRLAFPTTVAPRYVTATGMDPLQAMIEGEQVNPPHVLHVPYGVAFEMEVDLGLPISAIESPSHAIRVKLDEGEKAHVSLESGVTELDRDIVVQIALGREPMPSAQASKGPADHTFVAVTLQPQFDELEELPAAANEAFFVLDCSGSMGGDSITQARRALELCLRSLSEGDRFNVCRFGSCFEMMNAGLLTYSQETLDQAVKYVRSVDADLGGTELYAPLKAIFEIPPTAGRSRQVILLTDGQVGNEGAIIDLARVHKRNHRMFTFGIGNACSTHLVKSLARVTGGAAEFVSAGERIEDKVLRTFSRLSSPMATDIEIDWGNTEVIAASPDVPPLFEGDSFTLLGRVIGKAPSKCRVKITTAAGPAQWEVPIPEPNLENGIIAGLWARRRIQYLEDACSPESVPSRANRRPNKELVQLSKEFGILCSQTSFIALEHRSLAERNNGQPAFRRVSVQLPRGWGDVEGDMLHSIVAPCLSSPISAMPMRLARRAFLVPKLAGFLVPRTVEPEFDDPVLGVLASQRADGAFEWPSMHDGMIEKGDLSRLHKLRDEWAALFGVSANSRVMDTLIILVVLMTRHSDKKPLWNRAYRKAVQFIVHEGGRSRSDVEQFIVNFQRTFDASDG